MTASIVVLAIGLLSAVIYGARRRWIDVLLVLVAALSLAVALAGLKLPAQQGIAVSIDSDRAGGVDEAALQMIGQAPQVALTGHGLRAALWRDLSARPLQWKAPAADLLHLDFPRTVALGRTFKLTVRRAQPQAGWRLQLLAENQQVIAAATSAVTVAELSVQWLPPVAEALVLQARLLDGAGKVIAQGPVPLQVTQPVPLQVLGRFDAASFDARALDSLLTDGGAILDWQVTLGKAIARNETARAPMTEPDALFADAAYIEHLNPPARAALLAQVAHGMPLIVLAGNAADAGMWQREFGLQLRQQSATTEADDARRFNVGGTQMSLPPAALNPDEKPAQPWNVLALDAKKQPWLWQRDWQHGRLVWLGVSDWHHYAITAPAALGLWWQALLDQVTFGSAQKFAWQLPDPFPLPGLRSEICAQGAHAGTQVQVADMAPMAWQARADRADAVCVALWPKRPGWIKWSSGGQSGMEYIYAASDWPAWQQALREDETAQYAARSPSAAVKTGAPLPLAPFGVLFALCMLGLWWRERRSAL